MYISDISGHKSAAMAIEKAIKTLAPQTEVLGINAFNYTNPITEKVINKLYMSVIKSTPQLWDYLYDNPKVIEKFEKIKEAVHKFNSPKIKELFDQFKPDVVICTQAYPCGMVADYKKSCSHELPLIAVLTDYVPHSYWVYDKVDYYITPSKEVLERLINKGVSRDKIRDFGIPIDQKFCEPVNKEKVFQKLKLNPNLPVILIMGGGQGLGPIKKIIKSLDEIRPEIQEIVVTGTNKRLYKSLKRKIKKLNKKVLLFSFANNINELMEVSDIIISKPGGVTTAEVLTKKLPMIIVEPIPGQEENNTTYLTEKGAAIEVDNPDDIGPVIEELLSNPEKLRLMQEAEEKISKPDSSMNIAKLLLDL